jgi:hypothetical protein
MCTSKEFKEIMRTFKQLPDLYQQSIIGVIRHRKELYDLQLTVDGMRQTYKTNPQKSGCRNDSISQ